jgi:hypothetical protein
MVMLNVYYDKDLGDYSVQASTVAELDTFSNEFSSWMDYFDSYMQLMEVKGWRGV